MIVDISKDPEKKKQQPGKYKYNKNQSVKEPKDNYY